MEAEKVVLFHRIEGSLTGPLHHGDMVRDRGALKAFEIFSESFRRKCSPGGFDSTRYNIR